MVEILDQHGRPIRRSTLTADQTARVTPTLQHVGDHPSRGLTPSRLSQILVDAEDGSIEDLVDLFEDMEERDGHIAAELGKRRRAIAGLDWQVEPPSDASRAEQRMAEDIATWLESGGLEDLILDAADAIGKGFACLEIQWTRRGDSWLPAQIVHRPQRWFRIDRESEEIRLRDGTPHGAELWPAGWIVHRAKARSGHLRRAAMHRTLAWPYILKSYSVGDLAELLEIYGQPIKLGRYPRGASDEEKRTLMRAVSELGRRASGIMPEGMDIELEKAAQGGESPFMAMVDWCERTQSKVILGATLTSQADRGSNTNALGNVHNEVRHDLLESDARQMEQTLSRDLVWPLAALNFRQADPARPPRLRLQTQRAASLEYYAQHLPQLIQQGVRVPRSWLQEQLQIPEPQDDDDVLQPLPQQQGPGPAGLTRQPPRRPRQRQAALSRDPQDRPGYERQQDRAGEDAGPELAAMVDRVESLIEEVDNLDELGQRLLELYGELDESSVAEAMSKAFAAAEAAGRYDLLDEQGEV